VALPRDQSGINMNDEELVTAVVPHLQQPNHFIQATEDHSNAIHEQHSRDGVQAYAKLAGKDWTYYIKRLRNNIGRPPESPNTPVEPAAPTDPVDSGDTDEDADDNKTHVNLGPSKVVSRDHGQIRYDSETEQWIIEVKGRNGIRVNSNQLRRGQSHTLVNGEVLEIGNVEMMFVLPDTGTLKIQKRYLKRAQLIQIEDNEDSDDLSQNYGPPSPPAVGTNINSTTVLQPYSGPQTQPNQQPIYGHPGTYPGGPQPIAPAPMGYQRPNTPSLTKPPIPFKNSPAYNGTMVMHGDDIDLSIDTNHHIKPAFSYAQLIAQSILDSPEEKLTLAGIYDFIMKNWAYYRHQPAGGWQVSDKCYLDAFKCCVRLTNK
jgi:hypothetical protein